MRIEERVRNILIDWEYSYPSLKVNRIFLGYKELEEARDNMYIINFKPEELVIPYMFGIRVQEVFENNHLSVGFVQEEV